jgi:hypothetical protein
VPRLAPIARSALKQRRLHLTLRHERAATKHLACDRAPPKPPDRIFAPYSPDFRLPGAPCIEPPGVRDFAAPDRQLTLEGVQKPIAIGRRIFEPESNKQLMAGSPRLRHEPCVQLLSDIRQRVRLPTAPFFVPPRAMQSTAPRRLSK